MRALQPDAICAAAIHRDAGSPAGPRTVPPGEAAEESRRLPVFFFHVFVGLAGLGLPAISLIVLRLSGLLPLSALILIGPALIVAVGLILVLCHDASPLLTASTAKQGADCVGSRVAGVSLH